GAAMIEELEKLAKETDFAAGYVRVRSPHIARQQLCKKSGHLPYYAESMFPPMELTAEGQLGVAFTDVQRQAEEHDKEAWDLIKPYLVDENGNDISDSYFGRAADAANKLPI